MAAGDLTPLEWIERIEVKLDRLEEQVDGDALRIIGEIRELLESLADQIG
jgi:hypothetical protein